MHIAINHVGCFYGLLLLADEAWFYQPWDVAVEQWRLMPSAGVEAHALPGQGG